MLPLRALVDPRLEGGLRDQDMHAQANPGLEPAPDNRPNHALWLGFVAQNHHPWLR